MQQVDLESFEILSRIGQLTDVWQIIKKNDVKYPWDLTLQLFCKRTSYVECYIQDFGPYACIWLLSKTSRTVVFSKKKKNLLVNIFRIYGANLRIERELLYERLKYNIQEKYYDPLTSAAFKDPQQKLQVAIAYCMRSLDISEYETLVYIDKTPALHHNTGRDSAPWQTFMVPLLMNFIRSNTVIFEPDTVYSLFKDELFDVIADESRFEIFASSGITRFDFIYKKEAGIFSFVLTAYFLKSELRFEQKRVLKDFWLQLIEILQTGSSRSLEINEDHLFHLLSRDLDIILSGTLKFSGKNPPTPSFNDLPGTYAPDKNRKAKPLINRDAADISHELNKLYTDTKTNTEPLPNNDVTDLRELLADIRIESGQPHHTAKPVKFGFNDTIFYSFRTNRLRLKNAMQLLLEMAYNSSAHLMHAEFKSGEIIITIHNLDLDYLLPGTFSTDYNEMTVEIKRLVFLRLLENIKQLGAAIHFSDTLGSLRGNDLEIRIKAGLVDTERKILTTKLLMPGYHSEEMKNLNRAFLIENDTSIPAVIRNDELLIIDANTELGERSDIFKRRTIFIDGENKLIHSSYNYTRYKDLEFELLQLIVKQWDTERGIFGFKRILLIESLTLKNPALGTSIKNYIPGAEIDIAGNGADLLEMAAEKNYDLIFIELITPDLDGFTVIEEFYKDEKYDPLILSAVVLITPKSWLKIEQRKPSQYVKKTDPALEATTGD
jgi:CheY-like chemotaxis protein